MYNKEIDYSENIVCPYCDAILVDKEKEGDFETCPHAIFAATDAGFEYIREDMTDRISEQPGGSIDIYTSELPIEGIRIADYAPAPSYFGVYWGFQD